MNAPDSPAPLSSTPLSTTLQGRHFLLPVERRAEEFAESLARHGARTTIAAPLTVIPTTNDAELLHTTGTLANGGVDYVIVTTAIGFTSWLEALDAHPELQAALHRTLESATILARGAKPTGAIVNAGYRPDFIAESETTADILEHLLARDLTGARIAIQHHGAGDENLEHQLKAAGATIHSIVTYRWDEPRDPEALERSLRQTADAEFDGVLFTSAPAVRHWITTAQRLQVWDSIRQLAVESSVLFAAVGPVTAEPLQAEGIVPLSPERYRLGALVKAVLAHYSPEK
ncbi:uroporphyrinogen-III synthase [Corynebacterium sp. 319]|uniref:uroporphyrinogen-III synthase n=1 Tax=unclassified Corynebacterium TaxID=2624378 RepID=UPI00125CCA97|nr:MULTISPECIES: uroporphyrinogen-III synthase [unclassified Corynebacterium]KAB1552773.1 uroporphyrinogen-III synthase [Corynebacterium sp. 321]KAB1554009.1 uroporphyrinogen-III synthase [Corynebacterium sp. 319]KAB3540248.1 uroporphyrinogen-III synthase [Corynebacterium sp. 366]